MVGARTCSARRLSGVLTTTSLKNPAPKNTISAAAPPDTSANSIVQPNSLYALFALPFASLADTSLDTASGRLKDDIRSIME